MIALLGLLAGSACGGNEPPTTETAEPPPGFVQRDGTRLVLDGEPFVFTGTNIYNAASASQWCLHSMANGALAESLAAIGPGKEAFRSWFFQFEATAADGKRDWSALDEALKVARANKVKVIPVLVDQWGKCEGWPDDQSGFKNQSWYDSGYRTQPTGPGLPAPYREWVREVVTRYRDDPTILAWQLVNEAEAAVSHQGACTPTATNSMVGFATDMAALVKSLDPHHLLSLGTAGSGQCGARGEQYRLLHAVEGIDLCEYHDYGDPLKGIPGDEWNGLGVRLKQCRSLDKPLFTGEVGLQTRDADGTLPGRARLLETKVREQLKAGVVGILVWAWRDAAHGGSATNDYFVGPNDPALTVIGKY